MTFNLKNITKIITRPQRIIPFIQFSITSYRNRKKDIKLKELSDTQVLSIYKNTFKATERIILSQGIHDLNIESLQEFEFRSTEGCNQLKQLFDLYGSDKATIHNYHIAYFEILNKRRNDKLNILEIGLGTNNLDVLSNMGKEGRPGASLRAFRDFLPLANIYGADIDKRILFTEDRIQTFYIDQTSLDVLDAVKGNLMNIKFDLIIDDGLHNTEANFNTLVFALGLLAPGGAVLIEDIDEKDLIFYQIVASLLRGKFQMKFIKARGGCLFVLSR